MSAAVCGEGRCERRGSRRRKRGRACDLTRPVLAALCDAKAASEIAKKRLPYIQSVLPVSMEGRDNRGNTLRLENGEETASAGRNRTTTVQKRSGGAKKHAGRWPLQTRHYFRSTETCERGRARMRASRQAAASQGRGCVGGRLPRLWWSSKNTPARQSGNKRLKAASPQSTPGPPPPKPRAATQRAGRWRAARGAGRKARGGARPFPAAPDPQSQTPQTHPTVTAYKPTQLQPTLMFIAASSVARYLKTYGMPTRSMCLALPSHSRHTTLALLGPCMPATMPANAGPLTACALVSGESSEPHLRGRGRAQLFKGRTCWGSAAPGSRSGAWV